MKQYRFFYHFFKGKKKMSVHWKNACYVVKDIECKVPCETKWRKTQPYLVMQGFCSNLQITNDKAVIS